MSETEFYKELTILLNKYNKENDSCTPDYILTQFLLNCLVAWNTGVQQRENWYGRDPRPLSSETKFLKLETPKEHNEG